MKRILFRTFPILLALLLSVGTFPTMAAEVGEEIKMKNPGFEEATEAGNPGWVYINGANITVDTGYAKSGKNSLKIINDKGNNPWATQSVSGLTPGAMYELGAWLSTDLNDTNGGGVGFKIEQYDEAGNSIVGYDLKGETLKMNTLRQWNYHSIFFQTAPNVHTIKTYLRSYTPGIVWYDDVTVKLSGGPEPYSFYTDHVFHYPDEKEGNVYVRLDGYYTPDSPEATDVLASFTIFDGGTVLDKKENVKISDGAAKYTYPVSIMKEKKKQYVLKTELIDKNGDSIREWSQNMYVYDRPKYMPENGVCYIDGERFDPVIAYHADYKTSYDAIKEGGFTVVQTGTGAVVNENQRIGTMAKLEETGLKGLFCLYPDMKPAGHPDNIQYTKSIVEEFKDDSRIFAWAIMDEPIGAGGPNVEQKKLWLEDSYRIIRDIDDNHPVYVLDYNNHEETIKYGDVFVADVYCQGKSARGVSSIIEPLAKNHTRISTYELASSFKQNGAFPPVNTMRASVYRGFEAGGSYGTGFYSIDDAIPQSTEDTKTPLYELDVWPEMTTLLKIELPILFDYYTGEGVTSFNKAREGVIYEELLWETWFQEGQMYLLAHNRSAQTANFNIPLVSKNGKIRVGEYKAEPIGLTETGEKSGNGSMQLTLEQEQIALYKITPSEKVDLTLIDAPSFDDVSGDYAWAKEAVAKTQALGIINGKGEGIFAPGEAITRGDFAGFLIRTLGFTNNCTENFADVPAEREYAKEIAVGKALGILNGVGENIFSPEAAITRQDMMTICARGMKMAEKLQKADASVLDAFHDKMNVADYALESVSAMIQSGIIKGDDAGYLNPTGNTRRAEAAVIMGRILNAEKVATTPEAKPEEPKQENEVIEFDAPTDAALTKYNRSADLLKGLGTADIKVEASITNGEAEAIVTSAIGMDFDAFGENHKALTTQKAAEEFVKLLGYEVYTGRDGGFMGTAARIDLLKGIDTSAEYLRGGEFALMLENALGIYLCDRVAFGEGANVEYAESADTLLTRYRHFTLHKGVLEQNENTGLPKGKVAIGTELLEVGNTDAKSFIGQRVEAYTEGEENTIVFIRAHKSVNVTRTDADKINTSETTVSRFVYEDEAGHTKSISIDGAKLLYNGKYKADFTKETLMPKMGAVTIVEDGTSSAAYILIEAYNNYVVDRVWTEDNQIFFKNRDVLTWDEKDNFKRLTMEGGEFDGLKEWDVISLFESEDASVLRAVVSNKTVQGIATELSVDEAVIGESSYKIAFNSFGAPMLGEKHIYLIDSAGLIAGINDEASIKNYAYLTSISQAKGLDGKVQMRVFTKDGNMKILPVKKNVKYNGTPVNATELLSKTELVSDGTTLDQLIIMETTGQGENEEISAFETAKNGAQMSDAERYNTFTYDFKTGVDPAKIRFDGHSSRVIASKFIVDKNIVHFVVPETTSDNLADYSVRGFASFVHNNKYSNATLYDIDENMYIGAVVQKIANITDVGTSGTTGVVTGFGTALTVDGEAVRTLTVMAADEKTLKFQSDDFRIVLGSKALTNVNGGETEYTKDGSGIKTVNETMLPEALNVGDVVLYTLKDGTTDIISGMRLLLRGQSRMSGEISQEGMGEFYNYSSLTYAYGMVDRTVERGVLMTPAEYERLYLFEGNGKEAPVLLVEKGEVKKVTPQHIVGGDMVFVQKVNPYQVITVIYR